MRELQSSLQFSTMYLFPSNSQQISQLQMEKNELQDLIRNMRLEKKHADKTAKEMKHNAEKFHQASVTIHKVTDRKENSNDMMSKEIEKVKEEVNTLSRQNAKAQARKNKLQKRVNDEHHLIDTLNKIVIKLKKEITDTNRMKDALRNKNLKGSNHRDQLGMKLNDVRVESTLFYARA